MSDMKLHFDFYIYADIDGYPILSDGSRVPSGGKFEYVPVLVFANLGRSPDSYNGEVDPEDFVPSPVDKVYHSKEGWRKVTEPAGEKGDLIKPIYGNPNNWEAEMRNDILDQ